MTSPSVTDAPTVTIVRIRVGHDRPIDFARLERHFYTSSSCGVCGKTSLEAVRSAPHSTPTSKSLVVTVRKTL